MAVLSHEGTYPIMYGSWPIPIGARYRTGYIARPDEAGQVPVILVIPGLNGLSSNEKDTCRRLAREGFAAIGVDLYDANGDGLDLYNAMSDESALSVLDEVHQFVVSDDVEWKVGDSVGLLAFDVGGRFALIKAATREWVTSVAVAYAPLTGDEERSYQVASYLDHLPVPVLGLYGADDELIDAESVDEAQRRNESGQWLLYSNANHGFLDIDHANFDQGSADDAFARLMAFFKATLTEPQIEELG